MDIIALRRDLHQYPEVGFTEFRTASKVVEILDSLGYQVIYGEDALDKAARRGLPDDDELTEAYERALEHGANREIVERMKGGLTAVIGVLEGKEPGPTIAFRFDMDALPVQESKDADHLPSKEGFISKFEGNMHACAHDAHTAIGIGLAEKLADRQFSGTVKLIFQPAEEGARGAHAVAEKGHVDDVQSIYCLHLGFGYPLGAIYAGSTDWLATTKMLTHFHGVPSHTGMSPETGRNALLGAATALINIHSLPRYSGGSTRVGVGILEGGTASNITPYFAKMVSETRADSEEINEDLEKRVRTILSNSAEMHELKEETFIIGKGTTITCDEELIDLVLEEAKEIEEFDSLNRYGQANGGEDASLLIKRVQKCGGKGTYMIVGTPIPAAHHHQKFDIDEAVMEPTVKLLEKVARKELR